jgi:glutathione synthase
MEKLIARCSILKLQDNSKNPIKILNKSVLNLVKAKVLLIRNEPPFNQQYINTTFILENIAKKLKIINNPESFKRGSRKTFFT